MTTRYKALLIGASDYDEPGISSLPFVRDDLQRLATALTDRGFHSAEIAEHRRGITLNFVKDQVSRFLREARRDDTLFILLSGHGQHFQGTDYLIPEDASFQVHPFADSCVPLDWSKQLSECAATQVVFLIDACREGIEQDSMGPAGIKGWSKGKQTAALGRKVAYVYACSPGQFSLFVNDRENVEEDTGLGTTPNESFSLFARAVCDVVGTLPHALHLDDFETAVQQRIAQLHAAYRKSKPLQCIRITTDVDKRGFAVLPGPTRETQEHPWVRAVTGHPAWDRCSSGDSLKEVCIALAGRLAEAYETTAATLHDDPWHDSELAKRAHGRLEFLTSRLPKDALLSPTEAVLLVLLPFISQAFWAQEATRRAGALKGYEAGRTPEEDALRSFVQRYPRLDRRLRRLKQTGAIDESAHHIRWWLFHRWLLQQPDVYAPQSLKKLLGPIISGRDHPDWIREALSGERLMRFIKDQRTAPFAPPRPGELVDHEQIDASGRHEHKIRESLVSCLSKAAHALAIDPVDLSEVVAEHLGISDSVNLAELLDALRSSRWLESGTGRALKAICQHPAVEIALQEHAQRVDSFLRDINQSSATAGHALAPLSTLPPYANADAVRPSGNAPTNLSSGIRFHLAEDRVQELLMGEELYGDRGLAVRELYQNALDACRYRDARTTYLRRTHQPVEEWEGLIEFVQGIDDAGRPYLECRDNGIGMGVNELSRTFSQGGARFVDLPEYVEEAADWAELDPPVELFPNSRFGVGVLSYFMLADEITVHTCRLDRTGRPGRLLKVTIAGPGNLFRIEDKGPGTWAGTQVRLHLTTRASQRSALDKLKDVLWVAPYRTQVVHGSRTQEWEPGVLRADLAAAYKGPYTHPGVKLGRTFTSSDPDLWWSENVGVVLADGLLTGDRQIRYVEPPEGVIANLYGPYRPELSVDRRQMRDYDTQRVFDMMQAALPSLFGSASSLVTRDWVGRICPAAVVFADDVTQCAGESGLSWSDGSHELPVRTVGFFPPDRLLLPLVTGEYSETSVSQMRRSILVRLLPDPVLRWRLAALYATGIDGALGANFPSAGEIPTATPSDLLLLSSGGRRAFNYWTPDSEPGWQWPEFGKASIALRKTGLPFHSNLFPWRNPSIEVTSADIFDCVAKTQRSASYVISRFEQLGYNTCKLPRNAADVKPGDVPLLHPIGAPFSWLPASAELSVPQISYSAARSGCSPADAAARLQELGHDVPVHAYRTTPWPQKDAQTLARLWDDDAGAAQTATTHEVSTARIVTTAFREDRSIQAVIHLLLEAGFIPSAEAERLDTSGADDSVLLSDGLPVDRPVPRGQLAAIAQHLGRTVPEVAERMTTLGFQVTYPLHAPDLTTSEDAALFGKQYSPDGWPAEDQPLSLFLLADLADGSNLPLSTVAAQLSGLGYTIAPDLRLLESLKMSDIPILQGSDEDNVPPNHVYAAAQLAGRTTEEIADELTHLGLDVQPIPDDLAADIAVENQLEAALSPESPPPSTLPLPDHTIGRISLPAIASVAMRCRVTFREAALIATRLGMTHEAEGWFG